jgi:hypothetical protein
MLRKVIEMIPRLTEDNFVPFCSGVIRVVREWSVANGYNFYRGIFFSHFFRKLNKAFGIILSAGSHHPGYGAWIWGDVVVHECVKELIFHSPGKRTQKTKRNNNKPGLFREHVVLRQRGFIVAPTRSHPGFRLFCLIRAGLCILQCVLKVQGIRCTGSIKIMFFVVSGEIESRFASLRHPK